MDERKQRCETCRFWAEIEGRCHRHAPRPSTPNELNTQPHSLWNESLACWPVTDETDWCGEWQPADESKPVNHAGPPAKLRTPRVVANELGLPPWGFKKIRMFARRAGVTPAAMADNIPLYDLAGRDAILAYIKEQHPKLLKK